MWFSIFSSSFAKFYIQTFLLFFVDVQLNLKNLLLNKKEEKIRKNSLNACV